VYLGIEMRAALFVVVWIVAPTVVTALGLILAVHESWSWRVVGIAMVVLGAATAFFELRWFSEACWDTDHTCDGSALEAGLLITGPACALVAVVLLCYWIVRRRRQYRPQGT
jgi:MFS family permease